MDESCWHIPSTFCSSFAKLTGKEVHTLDGTYFPPPFPAAPEANGSRIEITGAGNTFLHLLQIQDGSSGLLPFECTEHESRISLSIADRLVNFGNALNPSGKAIHFRVDQGAKQVLLLNLKPGVWELYHESASVGKREAADCFFALLEPGNYRLIPVESSGAAELPAPGYLLPLARMMPEALSDDGSSMRINNRGIELNLQAGAETIRLGMLDIALPQPLRTGEFLIPAEYAAGILGMSLDRDKGSGSVFLEAVENPGDILLVEAEQDAKIFWNMVNSAGKEWSAFGRDIPVKLLFTHARELRALSFRYPRGKSRQYSLRIELSTDGINFKPVFDGWSKGGADDFERLEFPPENVQAIQFRFRGNNVGPWTHINGIGFN